MQEGDGDMRQVGTLTVRLPSGKGDARDRVICVKMLFGRTTITASAWDETQGEPVSVQLRFAHK